MRTVVLSLLFQILVGGMPVSEDAKVCENRTSSQCWKRVADAPEDGSSLLQRRSVTKQQPASRYCIDHFDSGPAGDTQPAAPPHRTVPSKQTDVLPIFLGVSAPQTGLEAINTSLQTLQYSEDQVTKLSDTIIALFQAFYAASEAERPAAADAAADGMWNIFLSSPALEPTGGSFNPVLWTGAANGALGLAANLAVDLTLSQPKGQPPYFSLEGNTLTGVLTAYLQFLPVLPGQTAEEIFAQTPTNQRGGPVNPFGIINSFDKDGGCPSNNCFDFANATFYPITTDPTLFNKVSSLFSAGARQNCKAHAEIASMPWWFNFIMTDEMPTLSRKCTSFVLHDDIPDDLDNAGQSAQEFANQFFGYVSPLPEAPIQKTKFNGQSVSVESAISGRTSPMFQCKYLSLAQESISTGLQVDDFNDDQKETLTTNLDHVTRSLKSVTCSAYRYKSWQIQKLKFKACEKTFTSCKDTLQTASWRAKPAIHGACQRQIHKSCNRKR